MAVSVSCKNLHGISTIHAVTEPVNLSSVFAGFGVVLIQYDYKRKE